MSRSVPRLINAFTLTACVVSIACNRQDSPNREGAEPRSTVAAEDGSDQADPVSDAAPEPAEAGEPIAEAGELAEEDPGEIVPAAPADYGQMNFATAPPTKEELTHYGLAGYEVVAVYSAPEKDSTHLGFLRIGARMRVGKKIVTEDCRRGWHALEGGGFACASRGLVVEEREPFMSYQPAKPRMDEPFPYDWAYVRQWNTPMWWQVPSAEALAATSEKRAILESERTGEPLPGTEPVVEPLPGVGDIEEASDAAASEGPGDPPGAVEPIGDGVEGAEPDPAPVDPAPVDPASVDPASVDPAPVDPALPLVPEEEEEPIKIPLSPSTPWLEKGYFLSLGETIREDGRSYWRTARGGVVEKKHAYPYKPKDYQGAEIFDGMTFPVGFVMVRGGTKLLRLGDDDKLHKTGKTLDKRTFLDLGEEVEIAGRAYFTVTPYPPEPSDADVPAKPEAPVKTGVPAKPEAPGETGREVEEPASPTLFVKASIIRLAELQPLPKGLDPWERWIDVDLSKQMLVAYEGARPVYVTLVSTGKKGTTEERFDTPTGRFRIYSKQVTSNMDGATATDGNYAIQDVPWVMYFEGSYALHGAFWHRSFGYVRSHGCINLGPTDARWLFFWTTPFVPELWHGVTAGGDNPGSTVIVRESEAD